MSREGKEAGAGAYAGVEIGLAVNRFIHRQKGEKLAPSEEKVKEVFQVVVGPISAFEEGLAGENKSKALAQFLKALGKWRKPVLEAKADLDLVVPKTSSNLYDLIDRLDKATQGKWQPTPGSDMVLADSTFSSLVSWLRYDINQWITEHS